MSAPLRIGVILLTEKEDHSFFFGPMGLEAGAAEDYLSGTGLELATADRDPPWSDYSDVRVAAAYCHESRAGCDRFADLFAHRDRIRRCQDPAELFEHCDVVVLLNTGAEGDPNRELVSAALEAGRPTFVDKFLAPAVSDARAMVELAQQRSVPLAAASLLYFSPGSTRALASLNGAAVTRVVSRGYKKTVLPMLIHMIAHLQRGAGDARVREITARRDGEVVIATVSFDNGVDGELHTSGDGNFGLEIHAGDRVIECGCPIPDYRAAADAMLRNFFDAVRSGGTPAVSHGIMIDSLVIAAGIERSMTSGASVSREQVVSG